MRIRELISLMVVVAILISSFVPVWAQDQTYSDILEHWAKDEIDKWSTKGLLQGSNGQFRPNANLTRAEMAVIVDRLMSYQIKAENSFADLNNEWYTDAILKNKTAGIIIGSGDYVRPKDYITRQEAVVMLSRALGISEIEGNTSFLDDDSIASWSKGYIKAFSDRGYINGMPNGTFAPHNNITRASVVKIIDNVIGKWITVKGTVSETINGTVIINTPGVTLKDAIINGDLIIASGVGEGEVILDATEVTGQLVIFGGGENSVKLKGKTQVKGIDVKKEGNAVRILADKGITVPEIKVKGETQVIIDGEADFSRIDIKGAKTIEIRTGTKIKELVVEAGTVVVDNSGTVEIITVEKKANNIVLQGDGETQSLDIASKGAKIVVGEETLVSNVTVNAKDVTLDSTGTIAKVTVGEEGEGSKIEGTGVVADVEVKADNVEVETKGSKVTVDDEVEGVTAGDKKLEAGKTIETEGEATTGDKSLIEAEVSKPNNTGYRTPTDSIPPVITVDDTKATSFVASLSESEPDWTSYFTISDGVDGDITVTEAMITEDMNMTIGGVYTVMVTVSDDAGNEATKSITVTVEETVEMLGSGTEDDPYIVSSIEDLCTMGQGVGFSNFSGDKKDYATASHYKLIRDLDFADPSNYQNPNDATKDWDNDGLVGTTIFEDLTPDNSINPTNIGFQPIGYYGYVEGNQVDINDPFTGTFDGNGYKINNLYMNRVNDDIPGRKGFFSYTSPNAVIKNIGLVDVNIEGYGRVGGLVGNNCGMIDNSYVTGSVRGAYNIGGLVGVNESGSINRSYAFASVLGDEYIGGLVGTNEGILTASYAAGVVMGEYSIGGLVGQNDETIANSYSTGNVIGGDYVGGLVGENYGTLTTSYSTGDVLGTEDYTYVGGLTANFDGNLIENCIAFNNYISGDINNTDRIAAYIDSGLINLNYAYTDMLVNGAKVIDQSTDDNNGGNIVSNQFIDPNFLESDINFTAPAWNFVEVWEIKTDAVRPTLIGVGNDDGKLMQTSTTTDAELPIINLSETEITLLEGDTLNLSIAASVQDGGTLSYEWYFHNEYNSEFNKMNSETDTLIVTGLPIGTYDYLVRVTNIKDGINRRESSAVIKVNVMSTADAEMPQIITNLNDSIPITYDVNETPGDLTVTANVSDGGTLSYQWYEVKDVEGEATDILINGAVNQTYTPPTDVLGTFKYFCEVTNTNNAVIGQTVTVKRSRTATIVVDDIVHAETPVILKDIDNSDGEIISTYTYTQYDGTDEGLEGLVITMNPVTDGGILSYNWYVAQQSDLSDAQWIPGGTIVFPSTFTQGTFYYYCDVTNTNGLVNGNKTVTVRSAIVTVNINAPINNAPTVQTGQATQTGVATPVSRDGLTPAVSYTADVSSWFTDPDPNMLMYSVVTAQDAIGNDVSSEVTINYSTLTYTPAQEQANKNITIVVKANDGIEDSTANVTITVSVGPIPNSKPTRNVTSYQETTLGAVGELYSLDVSAFFTDLDNDALTYTIEQENVSGITEINGNILKVTPVVADSSKFPPGLEIKVKANDGTVDSENVVITLDVKEDLTSVDQLQPFNVVVGTLENNISFPTKLVIYHGMMNMSYITLSDNWTSADYDSSQFGSYTFTQSFVLPDNITNSTNIPTVATVTVNVTQMAGNGSAEAPFEIQTVEDLCLVGRGVEVDSNDYSLNDNYMLMKDLDLTLDSSYADPTGPDTFNIDSNASTTTLKEALTTYGPDYYGFVPIAYGGSMFKGTFDGGDHIIKNLYINIPGGLSVGLFAYANNATIKNLGLVDVAITGDERVGGLIGNSELSTIDNCYVTGEVTGTGNYVGGLIGYSLANTISNSHSTATVNGGNNVGGIVGHNKSTSTKDSIIQECYATGSVTGTDNVGGLVGFNEGGDVGKTGVVLCSYAKGNVDGNNYVGGIVGNNLYGEIEKSYAIGHITGASFVGGLMGQMNNGYIYNSYALGSVTATGSQVGGLVGSIPTGNGDIHFSYATGNVSGADKVGGLIGYRKYSYGNRILNSITFNESATGTSAGRVFTGELGDIYNNYANSNMSINGNTVSGGATDNENGGDMTVDQLQSSSFFTNTSNWYKSVAWNFSDIWEIKNGALRPTLKGVGDDDGLDIRK